MNEIATIDAAEQRKLNALLGATTDSGQSDRLPILKVNTKRKNADGKKIPEGQFVVTGADEEVYAEEVWIRPLSQTFQWLHFDSEEKKLAAKTIIVPNFRTEPIDTRGTVRCGKPQSKVMRQLEPAEQKKYSDIKCYRQIRALVTYEGKTATGKKSTVENQPVILMLKGSNFSPFEDEVVKRLPQGRNLYDFWTKVTTEEHENGSVVYWVMHFEPDLGSPVQLDRETMDSMYHIADMIKTENEGIIRQHKEALSDNQTDDAAMEAIDVSLEDDFED